MAVIDFIALVLIGTQFGARLLNRKIELASVWHGFCDDFFGPKIRFENPLSSLTLAYLPDVKTSGIVPF
jgi:hypothetical protein